MSLVHSTGQCFHSAPSGIPNATVRSFGSSHEKATGAGDRALDSFKCWLPGGVQDLGEPVVEELLLDCLICF